MNTKFAAILLSALLPAACGQVSNLDKTIASVQSAISSDEQAANQIYLDDVSDSAGDSSSSSSSTDSSSTDSSGSSSSSTDSSSSTTDSTVKDDIQDKRLDEMVAMVFKDLDADSSGSLSLEEFLVGPQKRADDTDVDADVKAKMVEQMTADFNKYAGSDALLSQDELKALLKAVAPRVDCHRRAKFPDGKQEERVKESAADIIKKYDKDGDGKLSEDELQAMQDDRAAEHKEWRQKNEPDMEGQQGQGPEGDDDHDHGGPGGAGEGQGHH